MSAKKGAVSVNITGAVSINITGAKGSLEVLQLVAERVPEEVRLVETPCAQGAVKGEVVWVVGREELERAVSVLRPSKQFLSRIPGVSELCRKVATADALTPLRAADPEAFAFWPETWVLPRDDSSIPEKGTLILKPDDAAQGDGIYLLRGRADLCRRIRTCGFGTADCIVQRYLSRPALLEGRKFDMRLYAVVFSAADGRWDALLCREGLVRVCTDPYEAPSARNLHKCCAHLTNYSINKLSAQYSHADDGSTGSKRLMSVVIPQLAQQQSCDAEVLWERLERISALTIAALHRVHTEPGAPAFHILGLDVMLDSRGEAHLLEVNNSPSMCINSPWPIDGAAAAPAEIVQGRKKCRCMAHHREHVHVPCQVDIAAKSAVVADTLRITRRLRRAGVALPVELEDDNFGSLHPIDLADAEKLVQGLVSPLPTPKGTAPPPSAAALAAAAAAARRAAACRAAASMAAGAGMSAARDIASGQKNEPVRWVR